MDLKQANKNHIENTLQAIANYINGNIYEEYSGRNMFGSKCYGIICPNYIKCIEYASEFGIKGAKWDNLGKDYIVYWPHLIYKGMK